MCFTSPMDISVPSRLTLFLAAYHKEKVQQLIQAYANGSQDSDVRTSISVNKCAAFCDLFSFSNLISDCLRKGIRKLRKDNIANYGWPKVYLLGLPPTLSQFPLCQCLVLRTVSRDYH